MVTKEKNKWIESTVGQVMCIKNNFRKPISESERKKIQGEYPYYGPTKIQDYINEYTLDGRYVLIGEDGDHFLKYKDQSMTLLIDGKFNVNNHAHILQGTELCTTEWFYYYFQHKNIFNSLTRQGAGRYKLTKSALEKMKIKYPTIKEQEKIVEILSTWDSAIEKQEQLIEKKKEFKKGLMQRLLSGEVRFKEFKDEWKCKCLGEFLDENKEKTLSQDECEILTSSRSGMYFQKDYFSKEVASKNNIGYRIIYKGDFTYRAMSDDGNFTFNRNNLIDKGCVSPAYSVFKVKENTNAEFINYILNSNIFSKEIKKCIQGGTRLALRYSELVKIKIIVPEIQEQEKIAKMLTAVDREIELLEKELEALKLQKKGLMQRLLTGEVRVKV